MDQHSGDLGKREAAKLRCKLCKFFERKSPIVPARKSSILASTLSNNQNDKLLRFEDILDKICSNHTLHMSGRVNEIAMPLKYDIEIISQQLREHFNLEFYTERPEFYSNVVLNNIDFDKTI